MSSKPAFRNDNHEPITVGWNAIDQKAGMTFGELRQMVSEALKVNMNDGARVRVRLGWGQQVKALIVDDPL